MPSPRIASLDILRGFDIFCLVFLGPFILKICAGCEVPFEEFIRNQLTHKTWVGISAWDMVMPLFMFLAGASIPFAIASHQKQGWSTPHLIFRLVKRILILWLLGGIVQGNFLALNPNRIYLYTNTLQAIASGTLFVYPIMMFCKLRGQIITLCLFLLGFWAVFLIFGDHYQQGSNIAEQIDNFILGRFRDNATLTPEGNIKFASWYHYTWILSTLSFAALTLFGAIAGKLLQNKEFSDIQKLKRLIIWGVTCACLGWVWHLAHPIIKPLYTSSMVVCTAGYSFLILALFYGVTDILRWTRGLGFLRVIGYNALLAYCMTEIGLHTGVAHKLLYGTKQYIGSPYYDWVIEIATFLILYFILHILYKQKISIRA